ncbi:P-loop containing nucleoside triphosphate hydrolase protein [Xylaria curta]|nr:P-loop containing nucleoside triphosphate hydrolase protein [Xylaria curta]
MRSRPVRIAIIDQGVYDEPSLPPPGTQKRKHDEISSSAPSTATTTKTLFLWTQNPGRQATGNPDIKLATVGIDKNNQGSIISPRHARLLKLIPPSTAEKGSMTVEDIRDLSIEVAWVGKGQEGGIMPCRVSSDEDPSYDIILGVDFLSMHASVLFNERPGRAPTEFGRSLDTLFRPVDPNKRRNFFKRGIVIRVLWPQPHPYDRGSREVIFRVDGWNEKIHYKITWFVVIQVFKAHCIALPIHTYGGKGTMKPGVDPSNHAALVPEGGQQELLPGEVLTKAPFRMIVENTIDLDQASRIDFSKPSTIEYNIKVMKVGRIISTDVGRLLDYFLHTSSKAKPFCVPHPRNVDFFGREEQLNQLLNALAPSKQQATELKVGILTGIGGTGKSQLALEFTYRIRAAYDAVFWVEATNENSISSAFRRISCELDDSYDPGTGTNAMDRVYRWLSDAAQSNFRWLLVFDNIDFSNNCYRYIRYLASAAGRGTILLTSRNTELLTSQNAELLTSRNNEPREITRFQMTLDGFSEDEGAAFLQRLVGDDCSNDDKTIIVKGIVNSLGGIPLAFARFGDYINQNGKALSAILQFFKQQQTPIINKDISDEGISDEDISYVDISDVDISDVDILCEGISNMDKFVSYEAILYEDT